MQIRRATLSVVLLIGVIAASVAAPSASTDWSQGLQAASRQGENAPESPGKQAPASITSPKAALGFDIGDDYQLASCTQLSAYWRTIDRESDRVLVVEYGTTSQGRPMLMAVITSPENHGRLSRYQAIARRLALAEGLTDEQARSLAAEGKAVVWIDAGLHATETANAQALIEMVFQMASRSDAETRRILDDVILLAAFSNPDGLELVANWYMREREPAKRTMAGLPVLYQMGVQFERITEGLDGPFERINGLVWPSSGTVSGAARPAGYLLSHRVNDVFIAIHRLLAQGEDVYWLETPLQSGDVSYPAGTVYVPAKMTTAAAVAALVAERGLDAVGVARTPVGGAWRLKPLRIAVVADAMTIPQLRRFLEAGGTVIALGSSTSLAARLGVPVASALVEPGTATPLPPEKFYAPGSILQVKVDPSQPLAYGLPETLDIFYDNSPPVPPTTGFWRAAGCVVRG